MLPCLLSSLGLAGSWFVGCIGAEVEVGIIGVGGIGIWCVVCPAEFLFKLGKQCLVLLVEKLCFLS